VRSTQAEADQLVPSAIQEQYLPLAKQAPLGFPEGPITRQPPGTSAPLSFAQQDVWSHMQLAPFVPIYNQVLILKRKGPLNREALERAFSEITRRHATLRTTFVTVDGTPIQVITEHKPIELLITELSGLLKQQHKSEVLRIAAEEARQPFNLAAGPLIRARLLRLSEQDHVLVVTLCTIAADGWSLNLLACELGALYQAYSAGELSPLCDLPIQYADYAHWQRSVLQGDVLEQQVSYWRERLAGIPPVLELPTDRPRPPQQGFRGNRQSLLFSKELSESLRALSEQEGVTLFTVLLAAFQALLSRYTGQDDVVLGSVVPGRDRVETRGLIGLFAHPVVIRTDLGGDPTFRELLRRVRDALGRDCGHQDVSFDCLLSERQPKHDPSRYSLFRVLFSLAPLISPVQSGWETADFEVDTGAANVDLQLQLYDRPEGIVTRFTYNIDLFDSATILRMAGHLRTLLQGIIANPDQSISGLPLLTSAERHRLLVEWNDTHRDYPKDQCVHQLFEEQVGRTPDTTAVLFEDQQLTYRELNRRANQLAHHLLRLGVGPDALVGICIERSPDMVAGLLGILKAGGAYVPLDPQYPSGRLSLMLQDSGLKVLVTQEPLREKFSEYKGQLVCVDLEAICKESVETCPGASKSENLAYVIYTSGSTGKPKGVQISHRSLVNFLVSMRSSPGLTAEDTLLAVTTISFDIAALELYLPLIVGARLVLASRETAADGYELRRILERTAPTAIQATPATWRLLLEAGWQGDKNLKILCGGEGMPRDLAAELLKRASSVWNMYGPTETTVWSTTSHITSDEGPITIGRPIANTEVHVLDSQLQPVPVGVSGELYIGGDGVARGYLHRPELTAEKFIPNPFRERDFGARLYRTGDLARYRANGEIECLGRIDNQVKVRGFRIELGEIESVLAEYPGTRQNVVVAREDTPGDKRLVAYVAVGQGKPLAADALREFLKQKLPDYMLPSRFVFLEALPLTPNGKVDRRALPVPEQLELTPQKGYVAPRNSIESRLVKIWESVLSIRTVGVNENFFELGGHSLLVAKLVRRIEHAFGKKLSMAAIFEAPTIEQQASVLGNSSTLRWPLALVPIQPAGSRPPFFCFGFGAGPMFRPLARRLGSDQPLLGVDPTLLEASQMLVPYRMEDIAACLAKQMRELQPDGPYYLGGICAGGLMAYATASRLLAQGQQVALLALFEPHTSYYDHYIEHSNGFRLGWLGQRVKFHLGNLQQLEVKEASAYMRDHIRERSRVLFSKLNRLLHKTLIDLRPSMHNGRLRNIRDILDLAYRAYRPQPFPGQVVLFQATHREPGGDWERWCWAGLATTLEIHEIPGYSNWIVRFFLEPNVDILARRLSAYLPKAQEAGAETYYDG
jgi:aspartate racemase